MNAQANERRERALRCANASLWLLGSILPRLSPSVALSMHSTVRRGQWVLEGPDPRTGAPMRLVCEPYEKPRPDGRLGRLECRIIGSDYPLLRTQEMDLKSDTVASDVLRRWTWLSTWAPDAYEGMETDAV